MLFPIIGASKPGELFLAWFPSGGGKVTAPYK